MLRRSENKSCALVRAASVVGAFAAASIVVAGCGTSSAAKAPVDPLSWSVATSGPYSCGHRVLETRYTPPGGLPQRTISVDVWYPSSATDGEHPVYLSLFRDKVAWNDVAPAEPAFAGGMPVLVHSHGHKGFPGNSARLMCHAASHGWLAIAPEHVGDTLSDAPDTLPMALYIERPLDVRAALDLVKSLPSSDPLAGKGDFTHVGLTAHSFGTYSGWAVGGASFDAAAVRASCDDGSVKACTEEQIQALATDLSDPRPKALVLMAGAPRPYFASGGYDAVQAPVLMMSGTLNTVSNDKIYDSATKLDLSWAEIDGGCHQLFGLGNTVLGDPECAVLPDEQGFALVNPWVLAYLRYHVLADRGAEVKGIVEGTTSFSPLVHLKHKTP